MTTASWAICPACGAVTGSPETHAAWHATLTAGLDPTGTPTPVEGMQWPTGQSVVGPPPAPTTEDVEILRRIVRDGRAYLDQIPRGQAIIDAYLALPAPTTAQTIAHVRALTRVQRGVLAAAGVVVALTGAPRLALVVCATGEVGRVVPCLA